MIAGDDKSENPMTPEAMESFRRSLAEGIVKAGRAAK